MSAWVYLKDMRVGNVFTFPNGRATYIVEYVGRSFVRLRSTQGKRRVVSSGTVEWKTAISCDVDAVQMGLFPYGNTGVSEGVEKA